MSDENSTNSEFVASLTAIANLPQLNCSETIAQQFHQITETVYQQLLVLSEQSIFAPSEQIALFRKHFLNLLYQLDFDPLYGGLLVECSQQNIELNYEKPILVNSLIAELLLLSDRLLYTGELTQTAKLVNQHLHHQLQINQEKLLKSQVYSAKEYCDNAFQRAQLEELLDSQESLLLSALIVDHHSALETVLNDEIIIVFYNRSLLEAASLINMPFKQAQILEHAIQLKLKSVTFNKQTLTRKIDEVILTNCLLLQSLSSGIFYFDHPTDRSHEHSSWQGNVDKLFDALMSLLDDNQLSAKESVAIVVAACYYLQTNFSSNYLKKLLQHLNQINFAELVQPLNQELENKPILQQLGVLASVVSAINQSVHIDAEENHLAHSLADYLDDRWSIEILQKQAVQLDHQLVQLKSQFNPYRLVFCV